MNADWLAGWIKFADVDKYTNGNKEVYVATKGNEQLILTCQRVAYPPSDMLFPHANIVWIKDGEAELVYQDIIDDVYGQVKHSTGNISGDFGARENVETIWCALYNRAKGE